MSQPKHTPGPWVIRNIGPHRNNAALDDLGICYGEDGEHVCDTVYEMSDAHLIAAAPDMLEALEWCIHQFQGDSGTGDSHWDNYPEYRSAKAAIAKAKGGTE